MSRTTKGRSLVAPWLVVPFLLLLAVAPAAAQGRTHACLAPSGDDDTAALQQALDRCSGAGGSCAVALCPGVFHTGILRVRDFRGTLRGAGSDRTILRALPDLPVSEDLHDFFRDDPFLPGPAWPYLVQFVEGAGRVEDLAVVVPAPPPGSTPTTGWYLGDDGPIFELRGAVLVTGRGEVDFELRHVRVRAEDPGTELGSTAFAGVEFGGLLYDPSDPGAFPVFPARGRLEVTDSSFDGVLTGTSLAELSRASVLLARNRYRSAVAAEVIDADRSQVAVFANRWTVSYRGVQVRQNLDGPPSRASRIVVGENRGRVEPLFPGFGDGLSFQDPAGGSSEPGATALRVRGNAWKLGHGDAAVASALATAGAGSLEIAANRLAGRAGTGIEVDATSRCRVLGNAMERLDTGQGPDLHLAAGTSDCVAVVSPAEVVVDEGAANRVIRR